MKIWNLVAILAMSCLLPILAQKQDNGTDTSGSTCENELGQFCIDKNDTHKCMFPLAKPECPAGKQCCKIFPKDYDSAGLPLTKAKKCTKKCPCCIASVEGKIDNMESALKGGDGEMFNVESAMKGVEEKMTNLESAMNGVDEKITNLISAMNDQLGPFYCALKGYQMAYGDSCYFISSSTGTWFDAQEKCVDMGGNLLKIDNDEEFSFLQDKITGNTWIGLNDIEVEGQFTWISDGSIDQIPESWWWPNEPNNVGNEDCVHLSNGNDQTLLNDRPCTQGLLYICEMPFLSI